MDLVLNEEQLAVQSLAGRILSDTLPPERLREIEEGQDWFAADTWAELARADLLGLCLPESVGGGGYGMFELGVLLEQVGRAVAPVPVYSTIVLGALPLAEFGTDAQRDAWLPGVIAGEVLLSAALAEGGDGQAPAVPATEAVADGDSWVLNGTKTLAPGVAGAARVLVAARTGAGTSTVFLLDPAAAGVTLVANTSLNREPLTTLHLDGVRLGADDVLGAVGDGAAITEWITDRATAALCATQAGVCEAALRITATYTSERKQFGTPIATFQAVAHRAADAYIDTEAIRLTAYQATWRIGEGLPVAEELAIAKFWAAEGAQRVVHAAQHLHGGIGLDVDYPVHRTFRWAKHLELSLGGGNAHLRRLGALLAAG